MTSYDSSDSRSDDSGCENKSEESSYQTNSTYTAETRTDNCDTNRTDTRETRDTRDRSDCDSTRDCDTRSDRDCESECGVKDSKTPVGVWNLIYFCDTNTTLDGTLEWIKQLVLHGDHTFATYGPPDVVTTPLPCQLTPGVGVWELVGNRKIKLDGAHIGYMSQDGSPRCFVRSHILCKLNRRGNRLRFCGESRGYDLKDLKMCTRNDEAALCFSGHGVKLLEPHC